MQLSHELGVPHDPTNPYTATKLELMHDMLQLLFGSSTVSKSLSHSLHILQVGVQPGPWCNKEQHYFCIEYKDVLKLLDSKRELENSGGFQRIYPSQDGAKYSRLILHMHNMIQKKFDGSNELIRTLWNLHYLYTAIEKLHL